MPPASCPLPAGAITSLLAMRLTTDLATVLDVWHRRQEPESNDLVRAVRLAERFESDPESPQVLLALAYRLVSDVHEAAGWALSPQLKLSRGASAAASVRHSCTLLREKVASELRRVDGAVLLWGALGASQSLLGCWDALPAQGEVLVRLDQPDPNPFPGDPFGARGVRWAGTGELGEVLRQHARSTHLGDRQVLVPAPALYVALGNGVHPGGAEVAALVFCAAAKAVSEAGSWDAALGLAHSAGRGRAPVETAMLLGITDWLGLSVGPITRLSVAFSRLAGRRRPGR
jgi:hypothetical protein